MHEHYICGLLIKASQIHPLFHLLAEPDTPCQKQSQYLRNRVSVQMVSSEFSLWVCRVPADREQIPHFLLFYIQLHHCSSSMELLTLSLLLKSSHVLPSSDLFLRCSFITFVFHLERNQSSMEQSTRRKQLGEDVWGANYPHRPSSFVYSFLQVQEKF